jgi:stage IV sporulation protein B
VAFLISISTLVGIGYYVVDSSIPSVIRVKEGEESVYLNIPGKAEIISVSDSGESNIPQGAVTIDLQKPFMLDTETVQEYLMEVKLFGILPFKQIDIQVITDQELVPVGVPIGIYMKTDGILVVGVGEFEGEDGTEYSPSKYVLRSGDYIHKVNGVDVSRKQELIGKVEACGGQKVTLLICRDGHMKEVEVQPVCDRAGEYRIGAWVRDNVQGVGTMTYFDDEGNFGALGHGINDIDTGTLMEMYDGTLYRTEIISIKKGKMGTPGELVGMISYADEFILGDIKVNSLQGIFGQCNNKAMNLTCEKPIPIGLKQEIREGAAQILCTVNGSTTYYDIEITGIHLDNDNVNRGLEIKITDPQLLEITGGIVQGMSGAPIVQDGKFIGAVTHVLVQDSTRGYGIFIENMLEH